MVARCRTKGLVRHALTGVRKSSEVSSQASRVIPFLAGLLHVLDLDARARWHMLNVNQLDVYVWYTGAEGVCVLGQNCCFGLSYLLGDEAPPIVTKIR